MYTIIQERCSGCARCFEICPRQAIFIIDKVARIDDERCTGCGRCLEVCRSRAIVENQNALQKSDGNPFSPAKTAPPKPAVHQDAPGPSLWIAALDLVAGISRTLLDKNDQTGPVRSNNAQAFRQTAPAGASQRRRRRHHGRSGG